MPTIKENKNYSGKKKPERMLLALSDGTLHDCAITRVLDLQQVLRNCDY